MVSLWALARKLVVVVAASLATVAQRLLDEGSFVWARVSAPLDRELSLAALVISVYEQRLGVRWWPWRHPLWFVSALLCVRRDIRRQQARCRRVDAARKRRLDDYLARGIPEETARQWALERFARALRRIGEADFAAWVEEWTTPCPVAPTE